MASYFHTFIWSWVKKKKVVLTDDVRSTCHVILLFSLPFLTRLSFAVQPVSQICAAVR